MTEEKGLDPAVADKLGEYVKRKGVISDGLVHILIKINVITL